MRETLTAAFAVPTPRPSARQAATPALPRAASRAPRAALVTSSVGFHPGCAGKREEQQQQRGPASLFWPRGKMGPAEESGSVVCGVGGGCGVGSGGAAGKKSVRASLRAETPPLPSLRKDRCMVLRP